MAFPETPLGLRAELLLGGTWTNITGDVYTRDPIKIVHGTASEGAQADPASCSLLLNNAGGKYSPRNATGPYFGLLAQNVPVRVTVPGPESYLSLTGAPTSYARTPDPGLSITGDIDIRVELSTDWGAKIANRTLVGKWAAAGNQRSYLLRLTPGFAVFQWTQDGIIGRFAQQALPVLPERAALRFTLDVDNGAGGYTAQFYWAPSMDGPWTAGPPLIGPQSTSIFWGSAPLEIGPPTADTYVPVDGRVHRAEVRSGIGGAVVAGPDFRGRTEGTTSVTDSAGRVWSVAAGAKITDREGLFAGEIAELPPSWRAGGHDSWVSLEAAGMLRRLGQGRRPLQSTLRRRIPSDPSLIAYWPMEDGNLSTQLYSPLDGVQPLKGTGLDLAADSSLAGSAPLPTLSAAATLSAVVPPTTVQGWQVEMVYRLAALPVTEAEIMRVTVAGSAMRTAHVSASTAGIRIEARDAGGDVLAFFVFSDPTALSYFTGAWNRLAVYVLDEGSGKTRLVASWRGIDDNSRFRASTVYTGNLGRATAIRGEYWAGTSGMSLGHLAVFAIPGNADGPGTTVFTGADRAFTGESAVTRLNRLAQEEPALLLVTQDGDTTTTSTAMGPQEQAGLMTLVGEAIETDGGILYERMDRLGLVYRDRSTLYNQEPALTLDYSAGQVAPLEPVDDDATLRNDVTVSRKNGSSGRAVVESGPLSVLPPEEGGVGLYEEAVTLSLANDSQTRPIAGWLAHLGTWDEPRLPSVRVQLHRHPELIPAVLRLRIGDLVRIIGLPSEAGTPTMDIHVMQVQHEPRPRAWNLALVGTPAGPYRVGTVGTAARADTAGSVLASSATATATTLSVTTTTGPRWVTAAPNQISDPGFEQGTGTWVCTRGASIGVVSWDRSVVHSGTGAARMTRVHLTDTGTLNMSTPVGGAVPAAAGQVWAGSAWVLSAGATANSMRAAVIWRDAAGVETNVSGTGVSLRVGGGWAQVSVTATAPAGTVSVRLLIEGRSAWTVGEWWVADDVRLARTDNLIGTDSAADFPFLVTVGGEVVNVHGISGTTSPQTFYVNRSANAVVKPQVAGAALSLTHPSVVAL